MHGCISQVPHPVGAASAASFLQQQELAAEAAPTQEQNRNGSKKEQRNMQTQSQFELLHAEGSATPIKGWVRGVPLEPQAHEQLRNIASIPFVGPWVAVMPDVHLGKGATVGSVIPTRGAIIPAAVGVDIGCGMAAVRTTLRASDLPDDLGPLRNSIERSVPVGNGPGGDHRRLPDSIETKLSQSGLMARLDVIRKKHPRIRPDKVDRQAGTLG